MNEVGVIIGLNHNARFWHLPEGSTGGSLPDSNKLWNELWKAHQEKDLLGFAHSHPGSGRTGPSLTDLTTFKAIELGLGRQLTWWICSANWIAAWSLCKQSACQDRYDLAIEYQETTEPLWTSTLRELSGY